VAVEGPREPPRGRNGRSTPTPLTPPTTAHHMRTRTGGRQLATETPWSTMQLELSGGSMVHQTGPGPIYGGPVFICMAAGLFVLGRWVYVGGNGILDDQRRERTDYEFIRRIVGGGFMLFGVIFGIAGVAILAISIAHAV
jgi:hypothetical protein